jgi:uncharacterized protein YaiI (UPF0178 family)
MSLWMPTGYFLSSCASRCDIRVVSHDYLSTDDCVHLIVAQDDQLDASAWIAANIRQGDICITETPGLADRCILHGAQALSPSGRPWRVGSVGNRARPSTADLHGFAQRLEAAVAIARTARREVRSRRPEYSRGEAARGMAAPKAALG